MPMESNSVLHCLCLMPNTLVVNVSSSSSSAVSIVGLAVMATLFVHELKYYLTTYTTHQVHLHTPSIYLIVGLEVWGLKQEFI